MDHNEFKIHKAILVHARSCFIGALNPNLKIFHIANEARDATQAFWNKELGIEPGASDLIAGWPKNTGVLEIKDTGKKLQPAQNRFLSWAALIGWETGVAHSVKEAHEVWCSWGLKPAHHTIIEADLRSDEEKKRDAFDYFKPF